CRGAHGTTDRLRARPACARNVANRVCPLVMTCRTARELLYFVLRDQARAERALIRRRLIVDAKHRVTWSHVLLGIAVAVEAPFHLQGLRLPHQRHAIDLSVTRRAAHTLVHVDAVIEIDEVGQIVHARPLYGFPCGEARAHRLEVRTVRKNLGVAVHAGLRRWNAGEARILDRRVAVAAINAVPPNVTLVAELDRLFPRDSSARYPGRSVDLGRQPEQASHDEY